MYYRFQHLYIYAHTRYELQDGLLIFYTLAPSFTLFSTCQEYTTHIDEYVLHMLVYQFHIHSKNVSNVSLLLCDKHNNEETVDLLEHFKYV